MGARPAWTFTDRGAGDLAIDAPADALRRRREAVAPLPWTWLRQVHGAQVVTVREPGDHAGAAADAAVTDQIGAVLAVQTADCGPIVLTATGEPGPVVAVAHAGWRGLAAGVVDATAAAMRALGAQVITAHVGPHIRARCYEFGAADLDEVVAAVGPVVRGTTAWGTPALDLTAGIRQALAAAGIDDVHDQGLCTGCSPSHHSHRARGDAGRQAAVVWLEQP